MKDAKLVVFIVDAQPIACRMKTRLFNRWVGMRNRGITKIFAVCVAPSPSEPMEPVSVHERFGLAEKAARKLEGAHIRDWFSREGIDAFLGDHCA